METRQVVDKSLLDCMCYSDEGKFDGLRGCVADLVTESYRVLKPGGVAVFATKQGREILGKNLPCGGALWERWCGLDWEVTIQPIYAPYAEGIQSVNHDTVAVGSLDDLDEGHHGYSTFYICTARKDADAGEFIPVDYERRGEGVEEQGQGCGDVMRAGGGGATRVRHAVAGAVQADPWVGLRWWCG